MLAGRSAMILARSRREEIAIPRQLRRPFDLVDVAFDDLDVDDGAVRRELLRRHDRAREHVAVIAVLGGDAWRDLVDGGEPDLAVRSDRGRVARGPRGCRRCRRLRTPRRTSMICSAPGGATVLGRRIGGPPGWASAAWAAGYRSRSRPGSALGGICATAGNAMLRSLPPRPITSTSPGIIPTP